DGRRGPAGRGGRVKARRVRGLDVAAPLADNAERIVRMRLDELHDFVPAALDPAEVEALHAMRIAAKRLRYVLEVTAAACFGPYARTAAKRARDLQDVIGEIHDCDVALPRVRRVADERRRADAAALLARAGEARDLDPELAAGAPHADEHRGLAALEAYLVARRELLHARFLRLWRDLGREGFRARLEYALSERPDAFTALSPDGNVGGPPRT
ncbi:CHAD domain-containing protein, partial [Patulibacter sp. S7RM1-6]